MKNLILAISISAFLFSCKGKNEQTFVPEEYMSKIQQLDSQYAHHLMMQHTDSLEKVISNDAIMLVEGESEIKGINSIKEWYRNAFDYGFKSIKDSITSISGDENNIVEVGRSTVGLKIGETDTLSYEVYKYLRVWHKQPNGVYKLSREIWNN